MSVKRSIFTLITKMICKKYISRRIMFACIPLNPGVLMNNERKDSKKINIYIEYLK